MPNAQNLRQIAFYFIFALATLDDQVMHVEAKIRAPGL